MAQYYGIERSEEYLEHYGIKGMKWGVRKAIERGDSVKLAKHYNKAVEKLTKLSMNAKREFSRKRYNNALSNMASAGGMSAALSSAGTATANSHLPIKERAIISLAAGLGGGIGGALINSKGVMSGRWVSDKGHAKAIAKRNQFQKEMTNAFKGTEFGKKEHRKFQQQVMALSDQKDPFSYAYKQAMKTAKKAQAQSEGADVFMRTDKDGRLSAKQDHIRDPRLRKQAETYARHYNDGISRGMDRNSASAYANGQLSRPKKRH